VKYCVVATLLCLGAVLGGCGSKELTRSKAGELIKIAEFSPKAIEDSTKDVWFEVMTNGVVSNSEVPKLRELQAAGWITLVVHKPSTFSSTVDVALTENGVTQSKAWVSNRPNRWVIPTTQREFIEVTGITTPAATLATVEYTLRWIPTDSGKKLGIQPSKPELASATFQLFDDGWRMAH
jgi:hypothetical protein